MGAGLGKAGVTPRAPFFFYECTGLEGPALGPSIITRLATNAPNSSTVTWNLPAANGFTIVTECCGPSFSCRLASLAGDPIMNEPAGTTTISGHFSHSLNMSFGLSAHCSLADSGCAEREDRDASVVPPQGPAGTIGGTTAATCGCCCVDGGRCSGRGAAATGGVFSDHRSVFVPCPRRCHRSA
jgi:hypothetical protein